MHNTYFHVHFRLAQEIKWVFNKCLQLSFVCCLPIWFSVGLSTLCPLWWGHRIHFWGGSTDRAVSVTPSDRLIMRMMVSGGHLFMVMSAHNLIISKLYFVVLHYVTYQQLIYSIRNIKNILSMKGRN